MEENKSKVYVLTDGTGRITRIDGGYTTPADLTGWVLIDEGTGYRFNLCQSNYLEKPIVDDRGIYQYKLVDGKPVERTQGEMDADWHEPEYEPNNEDRIAELEAQNEMLLECLLEISEIIYA